jgi:hypothetical protein
MSQKDYKSKSKYGAKKQRWIGCDTVIDLDCSCTVAVQSSVEEFCQGGELNSRPRAYEALCVSRGSGGLVWFSARISPYLFSVRLGFANV